MHVVVVAEWFVVVVVVVFWLSAAPTLELGSHRVRVSCIRIFLLNT